jgi:DME family drug/metabolite transporter
LWGTIGTATTFAPTAGPFALAAASMGGGGLLLAATGWRALRKALPTLRANLWTVIVGGLAVAIHPIAFYAGMQVTGVAVGTVVAIGSAPPCAALAERLGDGQPLSRRWLGAVTLGLAGMALLAAGQGGGAAPTASPWAMAGGIALEVVAGATYALYSWTIRRLILRGAGSRAATAACMGTGGLALLPVLAATAHQLAATVDDAAVALFMAFIPFFLAYLIYGAGLARVSAAVATTLALFEPLVATILALAVVGERLAGFGWVGLALIAACLLALTAPVRRSSNSKVR